VQLHKEASEEEKKATITEQIKQNNSYKKILTETEIKS